MKEWRRSEIQRRRGIFSVPAQIMTDRLKTDSRHRQYRFPDSVPPRADLKYVSAGICHGGDTPIITRPVAS